MAIRKSELVTGTFMLAALAVLIFLAFKPLRELFSQEETFVVHFSDVGLLEKDATVAVGGLQVGRVRSLRPDSKVIDGKTVVYVEVVFDVKHEVAAKLRRGTIAKIMQASFLGNKYIALEPNFEGEPLAKDPSNRTILAGQPYADLFAMLNDLKARAEPLFDKAARLLEKVDQGLLSEANLQRVADLLDNSNGLVTDFRGTVRLAQERVLGNEQDPGLIGVAQALLDDGRTFLGDMKIEIKDLKGRAEETIAKTNKLLDDTDAAILNLDATLQSEWKGRINGLLDETRALAQKANGHIDPLMAKLTDVLDSGRDLLRNPDLYAALYELRGTLVETKLLMNSLRADPSQIVFGGPGAAQLLAPAGPRDESKERASGRAKPYDY
jgi:ABC-type transporter Mla subunit MlaD